MILPNTKSSIIAVVLAVLGFVLLEFVFAPALPSSVLFAVGLLVGGIVIGAINNDQVSTKTKTLYVGNLPYRANEGVVRKLFEQHGQVFSVRLLKDKNTGKRRGFGFVEMALKDSDKAVAALNDSEFQQRTLKVREAKHKSNEGNELSMERQSEETSH